MTPKNDLHPTGRLLYLLTKTFKEAVIATAIDLSSVKADLATKNAENME